MRFLAALFLCLTVAACAAAPVPTDHVTIAPGVELTPPPPAALGRSVEAVQMVTARHGDAVFAFEGHLRVTPDRLLLVGTDSMGRRAMTLTWDGSRIDVQRAAWLPEQVRPENVLADIVLMYWPAEALGHRLAGGALAADTQGRAVSHDGNEVIAVTYSSGDPWRGEAHLRNAAWDYDIDVRSQVVGP